MLSLKLKERQKEWLIKGLSGLVVFVACLRLMIFPLSQEITLAGQRALADQGRLKLLQDIHALNEKVVLLEASLATSEDRILMLGKISDVGAKTGMDIQNLTPGASQEGAYTNLKIDADGRGSFFEFLDFLRAMEALRPPVIVRELALSRDRSRGRSLESKTGQDTLGIKIVLESYLKQLPRKKNP